MVGDRPRIDKPIHRGAAHSSAPLRVLELFCGIGGCAAALEGSRAQVVAAYDQSDPALTVYRRNFAHPAQARHLAFVTAEELAAHRAALWWLSPPCQPHTRRGRGGDLDDPRSAPLVALVRRLEELCPPSVALENVPDFATSKARALVLRALERAGYEIRERLLCPSELGVPNRRRRYYLSARREGFLEDKSTEVKLPRRVPFSSLLASPEELGPELAELRLPEEILTTFRGALHVVDTDDPQARTTCFTAAYGRSPVRSGSYLRDGRFPGAPVVRRFSPGEILRLLGFPERFTLPPEMSISTGWQLAGNSLSLPAVRVILAELGAVGSKAVAPIVGGSP